jgi:hypothetical protein
MLSLLASLAVDPTPLIQRVIIAETPFVVRALRDDDADALTSFLAGLSGTSRRFWHGEAEPR